MFTQFNHLDRYARSCTSGNFSLHYSNYEATSVFKQQVQSRIAYAANIPVSALVSVADVAVGIFAGLSSFLLLGINNKANQFSLRQLDQSQFALANPFKSLIRTINPKAEFHSDDKYATKGYSLRVASREALLDAFRDHGGNFSSARKVSLLAIPVLAVSVLGAVGDLVIGIVAIPVSIILLGNNQNYNDLAFNALNVTGLVGDVYRCAINIINPASIQYL